MLVIKSLPDLLKYLQTRKQFLKAVINRTDADKAQNEIGQCYAFDEAIRAVEALIEFQRTEPPKSFTEYAYPTSE